MGEALVSFLDGSGTPTIVEKIKVVPPESRIGAISNIEREEILNCSPLLGVYNTTFDRESAYEVIQKKIQSQQLNEQELKPEKQPSQYKIGESVAEVLMKSTARTMGSQIGRQIIRGILGSLFCGKR